MTQPKDSPQKPKIMGYLHWQIGNDFATYHAMKPSAEFGITSLIEPLISAFEFETLQSKLAKAEAENKRFRDALNKIIEIDLETQKRFPGYQGTFSEYADIAREVLKGDS